MKIALIDREISANGGAGNYLIRLAQALKRAGHSPFFVCRRTENTGLEPSAVKAFAGWSAQDGSHGTAAEQSLVDCLVQEKPDVVHVHGYIGSFLEALLQARFPCVRTMHVYDFCPSGNKYHHALHKVCHHPTSWKCLPRMVYKRCTLSKRPSVIMDLYAKTARMNAQAAGYLKVIAASDYVKRTMTASGYRPETVEVLPYFVPLPPSWEEAPAEAGRILFAGRLVPEKGGSLLLKSLAQIGHAGWSLDVAGDGPERTTLQKLARRLNIHNRVSFLGWLNPGDYETVMKRAAFLVMPSVWPEPSGIAGLEAMSYGKPVAAFSVGGIPEWLTDGQNGCLAAPHDVRALTQGIRSLLEHPEKARQMGRAGRRTVEQRFEKKHHLKKLVSIYEHTAGRHETNVG